MLLACLRRNVDGALKVVDFVFLLLVVVVQIVKSIVVVAVVLTTRRGLAEAQCAHPENNQCRDIS